MDRSSYLNPQTIYDQCEQATQKLINDNYNIGFIKKCFQMFIEDKELQGEAYNALKTQIGDYLSILDMLISANEKDINDYYLLSVSVGDEVLDGEVIFDMMEQASNDKEADEAKASSYESDANNASWFGEEWYYRAKASYYRGLADNDQRYFINDRSFDCNPSVNVDINVAMAYLNLGVDSEDMCVKCLWGFSPRESWKEANLFVPSAIEGELRLVGEYEAGLTWRIDKNKMWESYFDRESGWYCIGNSILEDGDIAVKIIDNMIAVVDNTSELKAVWVQPMFV